MVTFVEIFRSTSWYAPFMSILTRNARRSGLDAPRGETSENLRKSSLFQIDFHITRPDSNVITVLGTEATHQQSVNYGCIAFDKDRKEILHYVEKPSTFVSSIINCGV